MSGIFFYSPIPLLNEMKTEWKYKRQALNFFRSVAARQLFQANKSSKQVFQAIFSWNFIRQFFPASLSGSIPFLVKVWIFCQSLSLCLFWAGVREGRRVKGAKKGRGRVKGAKKGRRRVKGVKGRGARGVDKLLLLFFSFHLRCFFSSAHQKKFFFSTKCPKKEKNLRSFAKFFFCW